MKFNISELRQRAQALMETQNAPAKSLISTYTWVWAGFILISNILNLTISEAYNGLSGLMSLDKGNRLLAASLLILLVSTLGTLLLDAGYSASVLKLSQGQKVNGQSLLWGLQQFPRLFSCGLRFFLSFFALSYGLIVLLLLFVPTEHLFAGEALSPRLLYATYGICSVAFCWLLYNRRLLYFFLARFEKAPGCTETRSAVMLLKGYRLQFLRIDLSHWWYYLLTALTLAIPYGSALLPELSASMLLWVDLASLGISVLIHIALFLGAKNRLWLMYALAFEDILTEKTRPIQEPPLCSDSENSLK